MEVQLSEDLIQKVEPIAKTANLTVEQMLQAILALQFHNGWFDRPITEADLQKHLDAFEAATDTLTICQVLVKAYEDVYHLPEHLREKASRTIQKAKKDALNRLEI